MTTAYSQSPFNKQRNDKFLMVIPVPKGLRSIQGSSHTNETIIPATLNMSVYGAMAPDVSVPAIAVKYAGQTMNTSSMAREPYGSQTVNFTIDNRFNNYWVIYKWLNSLNNDKYSTLDADNVFNLEKNKPGTEAAMQYYFTDISIFALDEYEKRVIEFKYTQAFPTKLSGITFNYRQGTEVECTLDFAYSQFIATLVENVDNL
jgi:hypothetical protein|tara:strand:+ start:2237 stop:2845 length:609 start_codon:yes stop_codon:yes gene_type:complete